MKKKIHQNSKYHKILTKDFLMREYINKKKSTTEISKEISCGRTTVENYLIKYNIKRRDKSANWSRENNPKFKHGKTLEVRFCFDCGKQTSDYRVKRCRSCATKFLYTIGVLNKPGKDNPNFGKTATNETKSKMSLSHGGTGITQTSVKCYCIGCGKEIYHSTWFRGGKRCSSCAVKEQHRNKVFNYKRVPNKPEILLSYLLKILLPKEYKYVGNDKIVIDTFNPDFINVNGEKKIIELYGDYWHNRPEVIERDKRRIKSYTKHNYKTLIIWEHELKEPEQVIAKIIEFTVKEN